MTEYDRAELAEIPFTQEEGQHIRNATDNFTYFLEVIYPRSFEGETFFMADSTWQPFKIYDIHRKWAGTLSINLRVCIIAPRSHLKSTVVGRAFSFWQMFRGAYGMGKDVDGVYFSYKDNLARDHTEAIKRYILRNPYCRFWRDNKPTSDSLVDFNISFDNIHTWRGSVDPAGILGAARGRHPKFVVCDDILSDFSKPLEAPEIIRINRVFRGVVMSMPQVNDPLILIGTPQAENDTLHILQDDEQWVWGKYPAIYEENGVEHTRWPEKFDKARLNQILAQVKSMAFEVEYMLMPVVLADIRLPPDLVRGHVDEDLVAFGLDEPFDNPQKWAVYGGMDVGKEVNPSHITVFVQHPTSGHLVQVYETWMDHLSYGAQAKLVNRIIEHFNVWKFLYDSTRAELDDRHLSKRARGQKFKKNVKGHMAMLMDKRFEAEPGEPSIILLGPKDSRQIRQISMVKKDLSAFETEEGHADSYWSIALAVYACEMGGTFVDMGDAGEMFRQGPRR